MNPPLDRLFAEDEQLSKVPGHWTVDELLAQPAVFYLKDVCPLLGLSSTKVTAHARAMLEKDQEPYGCMGVRKVWNHWYVRMQIFAPYYRAHFKTDIRTIARGMDANTMLAQKGLFLLSQVCKCIPFTSNQLRHQARKTPAAECGIFRDQDTYLVQMEIFGPWLSRLWQGGFEHGADALPKPATPHSIKPPCT